jgi:heme exporter protein CcmD
MMDLAAAHTGFVIASYAVSATALVILALATVTRDRKLAREAADLEPRKHHGAGI